MDSKPETWEDRIILFTGYLIQCKLKSSTIKSYISAIKAVLRQDDIFINENKCLINALTKACKYINDTVRTRLPIRRALLNLIIKGVPEIFEAQPYLTCLYQALFSTAYFGLFRVGELTLSQHVITVNNIHIGVNKKKMMFVLRTSKTHWKDVKPQIVKISSHDSATGKNSSVQNTFEDWMCPY